MEKPEFPMKIDVQDNCNEQSMRVVWSLEIGHWKCVKKVWYCVKSFVKFCIIVVSVDLKLQANMEEHDM